MGDGSASSPTDDETPVYVDETAPETIEKVMHQTVIKVTSDIENMSFNTAISQLMIFNNEMMKMDKRFRETLAPVCSAYRRRNVEHPRCVLY